MTGKLLWRVLPSFAAVVDQITVIKRMKFIRAIKKSPFHLFEMQSEADCNTSA